MTRQEYYDLLVKTSREGGFPAVSPSGSCTYLGPDGRRCAVGLLIPPGAFDDLGSTWRVAPVRTLAAHAPDLVATATPPGMMLEDLVAVQRVHDHLCSFSGDEWPHDGFVTGLNALPCFADCRKTDSPTGD